MPNWSMSCVRGQGHHDDMMCGGGGVEEGRIGAGGGNFYLMQNCTSIDHGE
jgi:hypothetical protein